MNKDHKIIILFVVFTSLTIFVFLRLSTALPGLKVVFNSMNDIFINKRNYSYSQKIEAYWKNDFRYSELVKKIVSYPDAINFGASVSGNILHPIIIANFIYPVRLTATNSSNSVYEAIYPSDQIVPDGSCNMVYVFDIDKMSYSTLSCSDYFVNQDSYKDSLGLIKK